MSEGVLYRCLRCSAWWAMLPPPAVPVPVDECEIGESFVELPALDGGVDSYSPADCFLCPNCGANFTDVRVVDPYYRDAATASGMYDRGDA